MLLDTFCLSFIPGIIMASFGLILFSSFSFSVFLLSFEEVLENSISFMFLFALFLKSFLILLISKTIHLKKLFLLFE